MKVMLIDYAICNGCYNCQIACKDEHCGNDWTPIAKPQPETGHFWHMVTSEERGTVPRVMVTYHHSICQHCEEAPCMPACPNQAIYRRPDGIVIIDPEKCRGSRLCIEACPYDNVMYFNSDLNIAQKCTFCAHLLDQGWTETRCVDACPTGALVFGEEEDLREQIEKAELLKPELPTRPRVYYLNLPKKWIAGGVYDPVADEVIEGATITVTNMAGGAEQTVKTDGFGDFRVEGLKAAEYSLVIEAEGFRRATIASIHTDKDVNLGDIPLEAGEVKG